ncbi:MAG TPA: glycosyltransferase family 2 protein [Sphingobium sp.]
MTDIKLSICIPTYNRAAYLRTALECLAGADFSFPYEIVISDNASPDDTEAVVRTFIDRGLPINYLRMPENAGAAINLTNAIQHAVGQYMIYQGDDDLLIPEGIEAAVAHLDANPDVTVCQAPWYLYNEVEDVDVKTFYHLDADRTFERQDFLGVFEFLFEGHVFPEIAIYRMSTARVAIVPRYFCFWPFSYLAHFLDEGAVTFLKQPFYRSVTVSKIAASRDQLGFEDVMTSWDMYRGGLEYFLHIGAQRGKLSTTEEARAVYDRMCKIFTVIRMSVAIRFWVARNDFIRAYELYTRMAIAGHGDYPGVAELRPHFPVMVGLQTLAYKVNAVPEIDYLILSDMADADHIGGLLRDVGLRAEIAIVSDGASHDPALADRTAILVTSEARQAEFIDRGYRPGFIFHEGELTRFVLS